MTIDPRTGHRYHKHLIRSLKQLSCLLLMLLLLAGCNRSSSPGTNPPSNGPTDNSPSSNPTGTNPSTDCTPDSLAGTGLFTSPPTDIANVASVIPLGNLNPGGGHVLSVDHMYLSYPIPDNGGDTSYPVYAMADGELYYIFREQKAGRSDYDYQVFIRHSCSVYSYYDHLHGLSDAINNHLVSHGATWIDISGSSSGPWLIFLGQTGDAPMLTVVSGEQVGITKDYSHSWDVGVVDTRQTNGNFINPSAKRYPTLADYQPLFPAFSGIDMSIYPSGNKMMNAACFIDYMDDSGGMQTAWRSLLASTPKDCGTVGWDLADRLRGAWFNPALDSLPTVTLDNETAVLSIIPGNYNPVTQIQIGIGNAVSGGTVPSLALLDPATWTPPVSAPQIAQPFFITIDASPSAVVNPDPAAVGTGVTVCYDLSYSGVYDTLLLHMTDAGHLKVKYDPGSDASPQCAGLASSFPAVDTTWIEYVR